MKNLKLPRKFKKGLKKAVKAKFPNWNTRFIGICQISNTQRCLSNRSAITFNGYAVTAHSMGVNPVGAYK